MQVILHIGDAKCGSSSIQAALYDASKELIKRGVAYSALRRATGHFSHITLLGGSTRGDDGRQRILAERCIARMKGVIEARRPRYLILSAENFFAVRPDALAAHLKSISPDIEGVHLIGYLRDPADRYLSSVQQILKADHVIPSASAAVRAIAWPFEEWGRHPLALSVSAREFDGRALIAGSVVADFAEYLRSVCGDRRIRLEEVEVNASISLEQMAILQRFRAEALGWLPGRFHADSNRLIAFFEEANATCGVVGSRARLKDQVRADIMRLNRSSLGAVRAKFPWMRLARQVDETVEKRFEPMPTAYHSIADLCGEPDAEMLSALTALIPFFNEDLRKGEAERAIDGLQRLGRPIRLAGCYVRFLEHEGCDAAADQVAARFALRPIAAEETSDRKG